jgi:ATP-dependent Clp protease adapter protein ClpS
MLGAKMADQIPLRDQAQKLTLRIHHRGGADVMVT